MGLLALLLVCAGVALAALAAFGLRVHSHRSKRRAQLPRPVPFAEGAETGAMADAPGSGGAAPRDASDLSASGLAPELDPATLGSYRLERALGRGSMGMVYLAHDAQRAVAIKTMVLGRELDPADLAEARARFSREAATVGRLRHRDIVEVFDAGEDQGLAYIAMEFVPGGDLSHRTAVEQLLPVPQVLRIVARVAMALAHAHTQGVVHRDVKPANVMYEPVSQTLKVTDFGIASLADAFSTRTGLVLGTPSYMAPEQLTGGRVDGRSDLYALGVMTFQLLTGALPHRSDSISGLLRQIVNAVAPDVRTVRPDLPEALAAVLTRALEKRPERRYADGTSFAADLLLIADALDPRAPGTGVG